MWDGVISLQMYGGGLGSQTPPGEFSTLHSPHLLHSPGLDPPSPPHEVMEAGRGGMGGVAACILATCLLATPLLSSGWRGGEWPSIPNEVGGGWGRPPQNSEPITLQPEPPWVGGTEPPGPPRAPPPMSLGILKGTSHPWVTGWGLYFPLLGGSEPHRALTGNGCGGSWGG